MKKTIIRLSTCILISALIWFICTWKIPCDIHVWLVVLPVCMVIIGLFSGISIKKYWFLPLMQPLFCLADYWLLIRHAKAEDEVSPDYFIRKATCLLNAAIPFRIIQDILLLYLMIALIAMLFSALIVRLLKRKKAAPERVRSYRSFPKQL